MLQALNITKAYDLEGVRNEVLKGVDFHVDKGEFVSIVGRSGSGKSTLLNVLSTLLRPDGGEVFYNGEDVCGFGEASLNRLRSRDFAMVFQSHHLLPYLTARENVLLSRMNGLKGVSREHLDFADTCLARVGLAGKEDRLPGKLSGGEQQRVAIARALAQESQILFADEPTGNLDKETGDGIMALLSELTSDGLAVVMVTHDQAYAGSADRVVRMADGLMVG